MATVATADCLATFAADGVLAKRASRNAPVAATTFISTATSMAAWRPTTGTSMKSVKKHPTAAPTVLTP